MNGRHHLALASLPVARQNRPSFGAARTGASPTVVIMDIVDDAEADAWDAEMKRRGF